MGPEQKVGALDVQRSAEVISLREPATQRAQHLLLGRAFHALADRFVAERLGQLQQGGRQTARIVAGAQRLDEGFVDLHDVDLQPVEVRQRGVPRPEVVERDAHAERPQVDQVTDRGLVVGQHRALGDLEDERSRIEPACLDLRGDPLGKVGIGKLAR